MNDQTENLENTSQQSAHSVTAQIRSLANEYQNTRDATYTLLSECLKLVLEIEGDDDKERELEGYLKAEGIKVIGKHKLYRQVVKAVVGANTKTASNYGKVLIAAAKESIGPYKFVEWIRDDKKGIENLLDSLKEDAPDRDQKFEIGKQKLCDQDSVCTVKSFSNFDTSEELVVLVGRITAAHDIEILNFTPPKSILKTICISAEKSIKDAHVADGDSDHAANDESDLESKMAGQAKPIDNDHEPTEGE